MVSNGFLPSFSLGLPLIVYHKFPWCMINDFSQLEWLFNFFSVETRKKRENEKSGNKF